MALNNHFEFTGRLTFVEHELDDNGNPVHHIRIDSKAFSPKDVQIESASNKTRYYDIVAYPSGGHDPWGSLVKGLPCTIVCEAHWTGEFVTTDEEGNVTVVVGGDSSASTPVYEFVGLSVAPARDYELTMEDRRAMASAFPGLVQDGS